MFSLATIRAQFPIFQTNPALVYLDNAASSQTPIPVIEAMDEYYRQYRSNTHRGLYPLSEKATQQFETTREKVAQFIHAQPEEIIFTRGATHALNILAYGLTQDLQPGDEILISEMEHHSNLVPWQQLAKRKQVILRYIPVTPTGRLDINNLDTLITSKTKIVNITHASNVLGTINPITTIFQKAHTVGAITVLDACQSLPHLPINVTNLPVDFVVFSAHKACGPTGVGVLYGKTEKLEMLPPLEFGGHMIRSVTFEDTTFADAPDKFEAGTANIAGIIGLGATIDFLQNLDWSAISMHELQLMQTTLEQLQTIPEISIHGPLETNDRTGVFSFSIKNIHSHDVAHILGLNNIAVRAGHHCAQPLLTRLGIANTVRASIYFYNTEDDITKLILGLKKAIQLMNSK